MKFRKNNFGGSFLGGAPNGSGTLSINSAHHRLNINQCRRSDLVSYILTSCNCCTDEEHRIFKYCTDTVLEVGGFIRYVVLLLFSFPSSVLSVLPSLNLIRRSNMFSRFGPFVGCWLWQFCLRPPPQRISTSGIVGSYEDNKCVEKWGSGHLHT